MRSLTKLDDWSRFDVEAVFTLAEDHRDGGSAGGSRCASGVVRTRNT
ncbi:hypothetical protein [Curtobacterium flaccumfaciens]|nr:hypothetical protein [Curtobacterium flaccumfaciens]MBT1632732.1 hypothetical protein [Curtobacterium flaccumfaciens pv. oortii]MCX2846088.1 hypothetical protein [Curtobacterium flaccumfaciens pv. oortii]